MEPTQDVPTLDELNAIGVGKFPGYIGFRAVAVERGRVQAEFEVGPHHLAPNGYLHAGTVVTLADTACGYGALAHLPQGAVNFTTVELKSNVLGTARDGIIACEAAPVHLGRSTQVWDAEVTNAATSQRLAVFRCTQMVLWPKT